MSNWEVLKELFKSVNFYRKKLFIFLVIFGLCAAAYLLWRNYRTEAQIAYYKPLSESFQTQATSNITVEKNGKVTIDGRRAPGAIKYYKDYDELRILVFDNPSTYITYYSASVKLPAAVSEDQIRQITYGVHGVGSTLNYMTDPSTMVYEASDISPGSTLSIVANLPKGLIKPPFYTKIATAINQLAAKAWLYLAITFPGVVVLLMAFMIFQRRSIYFYIPKKEINTLPATVSPAISGVVIDGMVGAREIAATLVDLANRGFIFIINQGDQFFFAKRRPLENLEGIEGLSMFEKSLLAKIFLPTSYKSTVADVQTRIGRHIFSRKIANFYLGVYNQATSQGYFTRNPAKVHLTYKYTGIIMFFLCFIAFFYGAFSNIDPKYSLLFWVGGMAAAALVIKLAPFTPARTRKGNAELKNWLSFRDYLTDKSPISIEDFNQKKYENYLPYAIVLGAEVEWTKRFSGKPFAQPSWYESKERIVTLDSFASKLFPLIGYVADNLAKSHDPIIE